MQLFFLLPFNFYLKTTFLHCSLLFVDCNMRKQIRNNFFSSWSFQNATKQSKRNNFKIWIFLLQSAIARIIINNHKKKSHKENAKSSIYYWHYYFHESTSPLSFEIINISVFFSFFYVRNFCVRRLHRTAIADQWIEETLAEKNNKTTARWKNKLMIFVQNKKRKAQLRFRL